MATAIPVVRVEHSSNIEAIGYDAGTKTLQVNFKNGGRYQYQNVTAEMWAALNEAESKGKYLNNQIKPNCPCHKLDEED